MVKPHMKHIATDLQTDLKQTPFLDKSVVRFVRFVRESWPVVSNVTRRALLGYNYE